MLRMIEVAQDGALWTVTLNRPDKANALTWEMLDGIDRGVAQATGAGARALVLTGRGRVFSAGADLEAAKAGLAVDPVWERLSGRIAAFPGLSIACLNGTLAGGAMGMALACDLRIAVPGAALFYPVMRLGFLPQPSDPARLAALAGPSRAKLMLMSGARVPVEEALGWGLIDRIVEPADLLSEAAALAAPVLSATPEHATAIKRLIR
jgi:enoyl-CoA hydratase